MSFSSVAVALLILTPPLLAQTSAVPAVSRYVDAAKIITLEIPDPLSGRKPVVHERRHVARLGGRPFQLGGTKYVWDKVGRVPVPARALISTPALAIVLLGAWGETGAGLGQVEVRTLDGKVLKDIDLRDDIADLAQASAAWAKSLGRPGASPWIVGAAVSQNGFQARIEVVGGSTALLSLVDLSVRVLKPGAKP